MKISGTFKIVKTNIETGEKTELESGNVITNRYYANVLADGSNTSIGFYLWTSPEEMTVSRRRVTIEASPMFLNDAYGYIPSGDWFARYVLAEPTQPGYFETRVRIDPPTSGVRTIRSIIMSDTQPRTDSITGLLPDHPENVVKDFRALSTETVSKLKIFAFTTLEDDCIQTEIEVFDIYYRLVFDNNYAEVNLSATALELLGKQSTSKMPTINKNGTNLLSTPMDIPALSVSGPVNFIMPPVTPTGINPSNGDYWHDYGNIMPATLKNNGYVRTYYVDMGKDFHVGKLINTLFCSGNNTPSYLSGYRSIYSTGDRTIGNTHSHSDTATKPFFDPSKLARGTGYCDMSSTIVPNFPEYLEVEIVDSGSINDATYKIKKYPFTGFYKNTFNPLPIEIPHISQLVINSGSWRGGIHYNATDYAHGFLTGRAGTHPGTSGLVYDYSTNVYSVIGRVGISTYSGIREFSESELIGYDNEGFSILSLNGSIRYINRFKVSGFNATNIVQVEFDNVTGFIYAACKDSGLYRVNSALDTSIKIVPTGATNTEKCYGFDIYQDKMIGWWESGIYYSTDSGVTWSSYAHPDYANNGFNKESIYGIRADLTSITVNVLILFSTIDGLYTTDKTSILSAWWSPTVFNPLTSKPSMNVYGVSPSFSGIDYTKFVNGTFYLTYNGAILSGGPGTAICSVLFNTSTLTTVFSYLNSSVSSIPTFVKKNSKDYILASSGPTSYLHNLTDATTEETVTAYGNSSLTLINSLNLSFSPFYSLVLTNGLVFYRGTSSFSVNVSNSGSNPNIRNNNVMETAEVTISKIVNPFFTSNSRSFFEKEYGWDGNQFSTNVSTPKVIFYGDNTFNGVTLTFSGIDDAGDFISGDTFTAVRAKGIVKDNASLAKVFLSNSNFVRTQRYTQTGTITASTTFFPIGKFETEEGNINYTSTHFEIPSRTTQADYYKTSKIPQEAGTLKITVDSLLKSGYAALLNIGEPSTNSSASFGLMIYNVGSLYKARITSRGPSYKKNELVVPNTSYPEISLNVNDIIEIVWTTSSARRVFSLKLNGTVINSGLNFDGSSESTNSAQLSLYYVPLTDSYPTTEEIISIKKPEIRFDETSSIISIPLATFINDENGLSINGDNYGQNGDTVVKINNVLTENSGVVTTSGRTITVGSCSIDNMSGTVMFSKDDQGKPYSVNYLYYTDKTV